MQRHMGLSSGARGYLPHLDSLRALSVVAVLAYHAFPEVLPAGFLGVDVFFVISGFLIGGIILGQLQGNSFSYRRFLTRRLRRLAPAFLFVTLTVLVASILVYPPFRLARIGEYGVWALLGQANNRFIFLSTYANGEASSNPFLHMWSLGVEEQFYLLLPMILIITLRFSRSIFQVGLTLVVVSVVSLVLSLWLGSAGFHNLNFYSLPTRAWELMIGVLGALWMSARAREYSHKEADIVVMVGLLALGASFLHFDHLVLGPSLLSIVPVGASLMFVLFAGRGRLAPFYTAAPITYLGRISYPLYLWHFPVLGLLEAVLVNFGPYERVAALLISFVLASATFHFVEKPCRFGMETRKLLVYLGVGSSLIISLAVGLIVTGGLPQRTPSIPEVTRQEIPTGKMQAGASPRVILVGDSHMKAIGPSVKRVSESEGYSFGSWVEEGCPLLMDFSDEYGITGIDTACNAALQGKRLDWLSNMPPSTVIVGGRYQRYFEMSSFDNEEGGVEGAKGPDSKLGDAEAASLQAQIKKSFSSSIEVLLEAGHTVVIIYPVPEVGWDVPQEVRRRSFFALSWPLQNPVTTSPQVYVNRTLGTFEVFDQLGDQVVRVYPDKVFCNSSVAGRCATHSDDELFYVDDDHLSAAGSDLLADEIFRQLRLVDVGAD